MPLLADTTAAQELGPYTALTAVGIVGLLSVILFWLITKYIPGKDVQREQIAKDERSDREKILADERESRDRLGTTFANSLKEIRDEVATQQRESRTITQQYANTIHEKLDRLIESFHNLALIIQDLSQQDTSLSGTRRNQKSDRQS